MNRFFGWQAIGRLALRQAPLAPASAEKAAAAARSGRDGQHRRRPCRRSKTRPCARPWRGWARPSSESELPLPARHCHNCPVQLARPDSVLIETEIPLRITRREFCQSTATVALATALGLATLPAFSEQALAQAKVARSRADGAGPPARHGHGRRQGAGHRHRICVDDLPALRRISPKRLSRNSRSATSTPARCDTSSANSRSISSPPPPSCWRAARPRPTRANISRWSTPCSSQQRTWAVEKPLPPLLALAKQAGFTAGDFRRLPAEPEAARRHRSDAQPRRREVQGAVRRRPSSSTALCSPAPCRSTKWPSRSTRC